MPCCREGPQIQEPALPAYPVEGYIPLEITTKKGGTSFYPPTTCYFSSPFGVSRSDAIVKSKTVALCNLPRDMHVGDSYLQMYNDNDGRLGNKVKVSVQSVATVAIGRRPYLREESGHILIETSFESIGINERLERNTYFRKGSDSCVVNASLETCGVDLGKWTMGMNDKATFEFSLASVPKSTRPDTLIVDFRCRLESVTFRKYRSFLKLPQEDNGVPTSFTQVDHRTRSIRYSEDTFSMVGWYYSLYDNSGENLTSLIARQARNGINTMLLYTMPYLSLQGPRFIEMEREILDASQAVGMKIIMDIEGLTVQNQSEMHRVIERIKYHPSNIGYYLCDDCCGTTTPELIRNLSAYVRSIDPYHLMYGATNCNPSTYGERETLGPNGNHEGVGLDVALVENYNDQLTSRVLPGSYENNVRNWPMQWEPIFNCPWSESSNQNDSEVSGLPYFSENQMRSLTYSGLVGKAEMSDILFFNLWTNTEDRLVHEGGVIAQEFLDLMPSLTYQFPSTQPKVSFIDTLDSIYGRAYEEVMMNATICIHFLVLNTLNKFQAFTALLKDARGLLTTETANISVVLPYEGNADRYVKMVSGILEDVIEPNGVSIYRIGCTPKPPADGSHNISPNPSFEAIDLLGGIKYWSGGRAGYFGEDIHRDSRARMYSSTIRPQHGRYSLRINIPTTVPLVVPWASTSTETSTSGFPLPSNANLRLRMYVRTDFMFAKSYAEVSIVSGDWRLDKVFAKAYVARGEYVRNQTYATITLGDGEWHELTGFAYATNYTRYLQLVVSCDVAGAMVYVDNTLIEEL